METLKAKLGPFPVWVWLALITALGLTYYLYERHKNPAAASSTADAAGTAQVPQVVDQTSTTTNVTIPPEAPEPSAPVPVRKAPPPPTSNWPGGRQPPPIRPRGDNERREKDGPGDVAEDKHEPGEEPPEPATHHGQHRHHAPPKRHKPPKRITTPMRRVA